MTSGCDAAAPHLYVDLVEVLALQRLQRAHLPSVQSDRAAHGSGGGCSTMAARLDSRAAAPAPLVATNLKSWKEVPSSGMNLRRYCRSKETGGAGGEA